MLLCFEHCWHIFDPKHSNKFLSIISLYLFYVVDFLIRVTRNKRDGTANSVSFTANIIFSLLNVYIIIFIKSTQCQSFP